MFHIVLFEPEIPPNTGNIIRLTANMGATLHLVHPLGFDVDDKRLRRAGLDYHEFAAVQQHNDFDACKAALPNARWFACSTRGSRRYDQVDYQANDVLLFGPETRGLPEHMLQTLPQNQRIKLPMIAESRSLNLANAVGIIAYEAWRQVEFEGAAPL